MSPGPPGASPTVLPWVTKAPGDASCGTVPQLLATRWCSCSDCAEGASRAPLSEPLGRGFPGPLSCRHLLDLLLDLALRSQVRDVACEGYLSVTLVG